MHDADQPIPPGTRSGIREILGGLRASEEPANPSGGHYDLCDFCRLRIVGRPVRATIGDMEYAFCSESCRSELERTESVFTQYHGYRRTRLGIDGLDPYLPQGMPRNAFVLLSSVPGSRIDAVATELLWRTLRRGEPAVVVTFTEPPIGIVQRFIDLDWNVIPDLEDGAFRIVDCFTSRVGEYGRLRGRMNRWNQYLVSVTDPRTTVVNDPSDAAEIRNKLNNVLDDVDAMDQGVVFVDSLTEFGALVQPVQAYDFIRSIRADVTKGRVVPIFAGANVGTEPTAFPHDLNYVLDGIMDFELADEIIPDTLIRRCRIRKMAGVLSITEWTAFEYTAGKGMVPFDPMAELQKRQAEPPQEPIQSPANPWDGHS